MNIQKYKEDVWKPIIISFELTQRCDNPIPCRVCAADASHNALAKLTKKQVLTRLKEAHEADLKFFSVTGGEPTLEDETLFAAIEEGERLGVRFNYLNTNCYNWGCDIYTAKKKLSTIAKLKKKTWDKDCTEICISLSDEHYGIPVERVANFIQAYQEIFPGKTLEAIGLRFKKKDYYVEQLIDELYKRNLIKYREKDVHRDQNDYNRIKEVILNKNTKISIFYNYVVPINRSKKISQNEYEIFQLTDAYLKKPISLVPTKKGYLQTIVIGWDNKASPDIVFKCTNTLVIHNSDKKSISQIIADGNQDPLLRAGVESVWRIIIAGRHCGFEGLIEKIRKRHSTIHGFIADIIGDSERKANIRNYLTIEDQRRAKDKK